MNYEEWQRYTAPELCPEDDLVRYMWMPRLHSPDDIPSLSDAHPALFDMYAPSATHLSLDAAMSDLCIPRPWSSSLFLALLNDGLAKRWESLLDQHDPEERSYDDPQVPPFMVKE